MNKREAHWVHDDKGGYWQIPVGGEPYNFRTPPGFVMHPKGEAVTDAEILWDMRHIDDHLKYSEGAASMLIQGVRRVLRRVMRPTEAQAQEEGMTDEMILVPRAELLAWAQDWLRENDPGDGTDCVTPFDWHLLKTPVEVHCTTCSCVPGMTPAIRFDATPAEKEGAVRDHLIRMGWTPPAEAQPRGRGCGDHDHASYIPGCGLCAATLPEKRMAAPPSTATPLSREHGSVQEMFNPSAPVGVVEALTELVDLMQGVIDGEYMPDSFTLQPARAALAQQPEAVDGAMVERIAALLHEEATDEPWGVAGVDHDGPDRDYYRALARKVLVRAGKQPEAAGEMAELVGLLVEVRSHFTRDDDLPDDLLPRIDAALAAPPGGEP